ncbi:hypothetical protein [Chryseobacterium sp.]|uniref:hypothetical protein n=1 Tax=Chryseobacterium sp. TaxID=1871047 RepID=UPI0023F34DE7|nr:hypothetical protein [Chryseobacterium sp.]
MKKILTSICIFLLFNCKSQSIVKRDEVENYLNKTIEIFEQKKGKIDVKNDFILLSSMKFNDTVLKDARFCIGIAIMSSSLTKNLEYKNIYKYKDFTVVSKDSLNIFKPLLLIAPYKNINGYDKNGLRYNPFNITLYLDKKGKIVYVYPDIYQSYYIN